MRTNLFVLLLLCASEVAAQGPAGYQTIQDEGVDQRKRRKVNYTGSGISCVDNAGEATTDCTVSAGGGLSDGDKGDITVTGSGATWTIDGDVVTFAKLQNIGTDRLIGRDTAATGDPEEITVSGGLEWTGTGGIQRSALTGDVTATAGSNTTVVVDDSHAHTGTTISGLDAGDTTTGTFADGLVDGSLEADELTLAGDVDGAANANDLDEAAVETELEAVIDLADLQGDLALGTKTSGNYVGEVQAGLGLVEAGSPGEGSTSTVTIDHAQTLAGNAAMNADECIHVATATGGGLLCEGGTADTDEMLFLIPDLSEADTTHRLVTETATQTMTNKTIAAADNAIEADTGDSATAFFSAGTIEDVRIDGSAEADELVLAGDVDGAANGNDLDEAAVESELEGVLDLQDLQGTLTTAKGGTGDDTSASTGVPQVTAGNWTYDAGVGDLGDDIACSGSQVVRRNAGDSAWECATISGGAPSTAEYVTTQDDAGLSADVFPSADDQVATSDSSSSGSWKTLSNGAVSYSTAGNAFAQAGVSNLAASTSADLRGVLSDEEGSGPAMFGLTPAMADGLTCTGDQVVKRNAGDTAFECGTVAGGSGLTHPQTMARLAVGGAY